MIPKSHHLLFYNFSTKYYEFSKMIIQICQNQKKKNINLTSGTLQFSEIKYEQKDPFWHYSTESWLLHLGPPSSSNSCPRSFASSSTQTWSRAGLWLAGLGQREPAAAERGRPGLSAAAPGQRHGQLQPVALLATCAVACRGGGCCADNGTANGERRRC